MTARRRAGLKPECCRCHRRIGLEQVDGHPDLFSCKDWNGCLRRVLHIPKKDR